MCVVCGAENPESDARCPRRRTTRHDIREFNMTTRRFGERVNGERFMTARQIEDACRELTGRGVKPALPDVQRLVEAFYLLEGCDSGGPLHVVLDDGNCERCHVQYCHDNAWKHASVEIAATSRALADVLLLLSNSQRRKL